MLILKKNIINVDSELPCEFLGAKDYPQAFNPYDLLEGALREENSQIQILLKQSTRFWEKDSKRFYPNSHKMGDIILIKSIIEILLKGLTYRKRWFQMNTYHFCILYDILFRYVFNYNHDNKNEQIKSHSKWENRCIPFKNFIQDYFFNTVFLIDPDTYNNMSPNEKILRGFTCPCQFAVINGLRPTKEEMQLKESKSFPYTLYV